MAIRKRERERLWLEITTARETRKTPYWPKQRGTKKATCIRLLFVTCGVIVVHLKKKGGKTVYIK